LHLHAARVTPCRHAEAAGNGHRHDLVVTMPVKLGDVAARGPGRGPDAVERGVDAILHALDEAAAGGGVAWDAAAARRVHLFADHGNTLRGEPDEADAEKGTTPATPAAKQGEGDL
jgi:hypothetical protein